jgi:hypothetical protein
MFTRRLASPRAPRIVKTCSGMSTVDTLIALGISLILLAQVCSLWYFSSRSFAAQATYAQLDSDSQRALDRLSKEIRQSLEVTSFATNRIILKDFDNQPLEFRQVGQSLMRFKGFTRTVLLNNVDFLGFAMFQRNPIAGAYDQFDTANVATCKLIEVRWKCSRKLHPLSPETSEYMQSAKIVLRSKQ